MTFLPRESRVGEATMASQPLNPGQHGGGQGTQTLLTTIPQLSLVSSLRFRAGVCYILYDLSLTRHVYNQLALGTAYTRKEESPGSEMFPEDPNKDRASNLPGGLEAVPSLQLQEIPS